MRLSAAFREVRALAKADRLWGVAFVATLLLPWMLIFSRAGMEICSALTGLAFLWHSYRRREWDWCRDPIFRICVVAWLWLLLVVSPLALNVEASFKDSAAWIRFPLLYAALRYWVLTRREPLQVIAVSIAVMMALTIIDTLWQSATGMSLTGHATIADSRRLTGPLTTPKVGTLLAKLLLPVIAILLALNTRRSSKVIAAGLVLATLTTIMLSGERAPFISTVLAGVVAMILLVLRDAKLRVPCLLTAAVISVLAVGLYATSPFVQHRAEQTVVAVTNYPQSSYGSLVVAGIDIAKQYPWHGVGIRSFRKVCPELGPEGDRFRSMHPHNAYIEWLTEAGVVGLLLFVGMLALFARDAWRYYRLTSGIERLLPTLALGVLVQHFFPLMGMQSFFINWSAYTVWFSLSLIFAALPRVTR